jgi:hypothetical protein
MNAHATKLTLALIVLGSAMPSHAFQADRYAGSFLEVCNKGTVPVEVVGINILDTP